MNPNNENKICILHGNASKDLAQQIASYWGNLTETGENQSLEAKQVSLVNAEVKTFNDGEVSVVVKENIRGQDVFIVHSFYTAYKKNTEGLFETERSVNDHLMELLLMVDACKRASAASITAVIPYFGYARQDRKIARTPISAKLVADMLTVSGVSRVVTMDLHAGQLQGFFNVPVDNLYGAVVAAKYISSQLDAEQRKNLVIVSPDVGGAQRARTFKDTIEALFPENQEFVIENNKRKRKIVVKVPLAIIDKVRETAGESEVMHVIGEVEGKTVVIVDDLVDTSGTLCKGADALKHKGAGAIYAFCTHPVMSDKLVKSKNDNDQSRYKGLRTAVEKLNASHLKQLFVSDTIPLREDQKACDKIKVLSQDHMFAMAIDCIFNNRSISQVFDVARSSSLSKC